MSPRKLSDEDRDEILDLYRNSDETTSTLAVRFGVSSSTISRFLKNNLTELEYEDLIQQKRLARTSNTHGTFELDFFEQSSGQKTSAPDIPTQTSLFELDNSLLTTPNSQSKSPSTEDGWENTEQKHTEIWEQKESPFNQPQEITVVQENPKSVIPEPQKITVLVEKQESIVTEPQEITVLVEKQESIVTEPQEITVLVEKQESIVTEPQEITVLVEKQESIVTEPQEITVLVEKQESIVTEPQDVTVFREKESGLSESPKIRETREGKEDTLSEPQKITDLVEAEIATETQQYPLDSEQNLQDSAQDQENLVSSTTETQQSLLAMENDDLKLTESPLYTQPPLVNRETTESELDFEEVEDLPPVNVYAEMYGEDIEDEDEEEEEEEDWEEEVVSIKQPILPSQIQVLPLSEAQFPHHCYLVIDRSAELVTRPLSDFAALGKIPREEVQERTLPIFDNHRVAKRFCSRKDKVIKLPDGKILPKTSSFLKAKGITRMLIDGRIYSLS
jgi:hypothetical protein